MIDLKHQIPIIAPPDRVYAALVTEAGLRGWWTADCLAEEKVGGKAEFGFERHSIMYRMSIEALEPGRRVVWRCHGDQPEWDGTSLTWTLADDGGATMLRFTHGGWREMSEFCARCNATWGELMYRLKNYVEGRDPGPHWRD